MTIEVEIAGKWFQSRAPGVLKQTHYVGPAICALVSVYQSACRGELDPCDEAALNKMFSERNQKAVRGNSNIDYHEVSRIMSEGLGLAAERYARSEGASISA